VTKYAKIIVDHKDFNCSCSLLDELTPTEWLGPSFAKVLVLFSEIPFPRYVLTIDYYTMSGPGLGFIAI